MNMLIIYDDDDMVDQDHMLLFHLFYEQYKVQSPVHNEQKLTLR